MYILIATTFWQGSLVTDGVCVGVDESLKDNIVGYKGKIPRVFESRKAALEHLESHGYKENVWIYRGVKLIVAYTVEREATYLARTAA